MQTPRTATTDIERRLDQSIRSRSFLALGVPAHRLRRFTSAVQDRYAATLVDVTGILLEELRSQAGKAGLPWDLVLAADAAPPDSRDRRGLAELVKRSWDTVAGAVEEALAADGDAPVVVTEAAPLARYDNMGLLARWTDLGTSRTPGGLAGRAADRRRERGVAGRPPGAAGHTQPVRRPRHDVDRRPRHDGRHRETRRERSLT